MPRYQLILTSEEIFANMYKYSVVNDTGGEFIWWRNIVKGTPA